MGLLDWLDPTRDWPAAAGPAPELNRALMQFEDLRFGDPLESAKFLGRPDDFRWSNRIKRDCELLYAPRGLRLRFGGGRLRELAFLIGRHSCSHPGFVPAQPMAPDGRQLTADADRSRLVALFGEPDPGGSDDRCLQVFHGSVASDLNLDDSGRLEEWALYSVE